MGRVRGTLLQRGEQSVNNELYFFAEREHCVSASLLPENFHHRFASREERPLVIHDDEADSVPLWQLAGYGRQQAPVVPDSDQPSVVDVDEVNGLFFNF